VTLTGREGELDELARHADLACSGAGAMVIVSGESGAGKTAFVETFLRSGPPFERILWGACDPLSTPRPLGPIHDLADQFASATWRALQDSAQAYEMFAAVFGELVTAPSVLVVDDLHWADQATIDLLRFVLRRIRRTSSLVIGTVRDDEIAPTDHLRMLLGDVARSADGFSLTLAPLTIEAVTSLVADRSVDPFRLRRITGGNAFFVTEMLDHSGDDVPTTVRDALLARTVGFDVAAWDLLYLLTCSPGPIPDNLLAGLGITVPALRAAHDANLIRQTQRGVAFRHDLCRLAIGSVIPPGAETAVHRRMLAAYEAVPATDPALLTHHALGAGDRTGIRDVASQAGEAAAHSGAHTQAAQFYAIALEKGGLQEPEVEAELLEHLADEYYLIDRLDDAITACQRALKLREQMSTPGPISGNHHSLSVYQWYNGDRAAAESHVAQAVSAFADDTETHDGGALTQLGHAFAMQAYLAVQGSDLAKAQQRLSRARTVAAQVDDAGLKVRVALIEAYCAMLTGQPEGRDAILSVVRSAPEHFDEIYSSGYSNLGYLDVEQRRLVEATDLLAVSLPLTVERDMPICRVWQLGSRARLQLLQGDWDAAISDADAVLTGPSAPVARTWPLLVRALTSLRRDGTGEADLSEAWRLACRLGELMRILPAAAAIAEASWLSGAPDDRVEQYLTVLTEAPAAGLEWSRGELAVWLRRLGISVELSDIAEPYRLLLDGAHQAAADAFDRLHTPYDAALALADSGDPALARRALHTFDRLGAAAVAAKIRRDLRSDGIADIPARPRATTLANAAGLTRRQVDVLRLIGEGMTNAELAQRLYLSVKTVDHHVSAILMKLAVTGRRDAVRRGRELGILT
jgi:DNA-binding CsgD family transcriptional regulator/tetratricopeptide (TPR) repeat protein